MLISMTGFGRSTLETPMGRLTVEIQSVNRKYLEVFVSLPKEFSRFEIEVRKWVGEIISRGQISVRVSLTSTTPAAGLPDGALLKTLKKEWEKRAKQAGTDPKEITLPFIMHYLPASKGEISKEEDLAPLQQAVVEALQSLLSMKKKEGKALAADLSGRLKLLAKIMGKIERLSPDATKRMRQKLFEKMEEAMKFGPDVEERLLREVALFAERVDVSEEITRFRSHLDQFGEISKGGGRKMDFLIQEMGREINTIGSKSMDAKVAHLVVEMKSELEKMREQIQNIE